jgi:hypothetical protein
MSISIDLDFNDYKPNYKNLLIVGTYFEDCLSNGFPKDEGIEKLYKFSDLTEPVIETLTKNKLVGVLTYQCIGFDVYYVKDTIGIRKNLNIVLDENFDSSKNYIIIKKDKNWDYYFRKIYPDNLTFEYFSDHQFLFEMVSKGDDLMGKRKINHWLYFNSLKKRDKFMEKVKRLNFSIDSVNIKKERRFPYELQLSRNDFVDPKSISELTRILKVLINPSNGLYEGWGTELIVKN